MAGGARPSARGQLAGRRGPLAQQLDHPAALRIGQGRQGGVDAARTPRSHGRHPQSDVLIVRPLAFSISSTLTWAIGWSKHQTWPSGSSAR